MDSQIRMTNIKYQITSWRRILSAVLAFVFSTTTLIGTVPLQGGFALPTNTRETRWDSPHQLAPGSRFVARVFTDEDAQRLRAEAARVRMPLKFTEDILWLANLDSSDAYFPLKLRRLIMPSVIRALMRFDEEDRESLGRLRERLEMYRRHIKLHTLVTILKSVESNTAEAINALLNSEEMYELYSDEIKSLDKLPHSVLNPDTRYSDLAMDILARKPRSLAAVLNAKGRSYGLWHFLAVLLESLPEDTREKAASGIIDRLNEGNFPEDLGSEYDKKFFLTFISTATTSFRNRVGLLKNPDIFEKIYAVALSWFIEEVSIFDLNREQCVALFGEDTLEEELAQGYDELDSEQSYAVEVFNYNPGPEMLKRVISLYRGVKGKDERPALSDVEANAFSWLVGHIPKKKGNMRDRRRQVHRYLLRLLEYKLREGAGSARVFMGDVVGRIDTGRQVTPDEADAILEFILNFSNLSRGMQDRFAREAAPLLAGWRREENGRKLFMKPEHFVRLNAMITEVLVNSLLDNATTLTPNDKGKLRAHVKKHPQAWQNGDFLHMLASYHSFQGDEGKAHTEAFLRQLIKSKIDNGHFVNIPRYIWEDKNINKWLGKGLIDKMRRGRRVEIEVPRGSEGLSGQFIGIKQDILVHLGVRSAEDLQDSEASIDRILREDANKGIPQEELETLKGVVKEVVAALDMASPISRDQVEVWKRKLYPPKSQTPPMWYQRNLSWREVMRNLDQIVEVQSVDYSNIDKLYFEITDDPVAFARSGMEPYQTCQRLTEPTGHNEKGKPINRVRQGQFLLARIVAHNKDGTMDVVSRSILEIAKGSVFRNEPSFAMTRDEVIMASLFGLKRGSKKALCVERLYQTALIPSGMMSREILKWALEDDEIDYVVLPRLDLFQEASRRIRLEFLPSDGEVYRDTFYEAYWLAIDMEQVREMREHNSGDTMLNSAALCPPMASEAQQALRRSP